MHFDAAEHLRISRSLNVLYLCLQTHTRAGGFSLALFFSPYLLLVIYNDHHDRVVQSNPINSSVQDFRSAWVLGSAV